MDWGSVLISVITNAVFIAIATAFINHRFNKKLEDYRFDIKLREQAFKIAEYLSLVYASRVDSNIPHDIIKENRLAWELLLLLPDDSYLELKNALDDKNSETDIFKALIKVRQFLRKEQTKITNDDVFFHYPKKRNSVLRREIKSDIDRDSQT